MKTVNTLIIGAGVSGLSYANFCNEDYMIVEKEDEVGGLCRTIYQDGFVWDYAGHFFHFADKDIKDFFDTHINMEDLVTCKKNTAIYYEGRLIDYPFQMNIHQLPKSEFIECLYDLFHRNEKAKYNDFEEMLYGKFGKGITEKFLKPYNEKLYACDLSDLDTDAMGRFFPYADPMKIIDNMKKESVETYNNTFEYPKRGAKLFIDVLMKNIHIDKLMMNSMVRAIDPLSKVVNVNGNDIKYTKLVNTIPFNKFVKCLPDEYSGMIRHGLSANKVLVFNMGFDKQALDTNIHWMYFPDKKINFYRVGFYSNILKGNKMSIYVEIGYRESQSIDINEELNKTLVNLKKCGIISNHHLVSYNHVIMDPAYVHITHETQKEIATLKQELAKNDIFTIGRYGNWTYCSIEDCVKQAKGLINMSERI